MKDRSADSAAPGGIRLEPTLASIDRAAAHAAAFCREQGLDVAMQHRLVLIVEELITNTVSYGQPAPASQITVVLDREPGHVLLVYRDGGEPFDPLEDGSEPDLSPTTERAREGGIGWPIIRHYCDSIEYRRDGDENVLHFVIPVSEADGVSTLD